MEQASKYGIAIFMFFAYNNYKNDNCNMVFRRKENKNGNIKCYP